MCHKRPHCSEKRHKNAWEGKAVLLPLVRATIQGDHSPCAKPSVDVKIKVPLWPGQVRAGQAKTELLFQSQREVLHKVNGHPVLIFQNFALMTVPYVLIVLSVNTRLMLELNLVRYFYLCWSSLMNGALIEGNIAPFETSTTFSDFVKETRWETHQMDLRPRP